MPQPELSIAHNVNDYFEDIVAQAVRSRKLEASGAAIQYLVGILADFARPDSHIESTLREPVTFLMRDAMEAHGAEKFRRLRCLGDGILYVVGFFGAQTKLLGSERRYFLGVGASAYNHAAIMVKSGQDVGPDVLTEMAERFEDFTRVLTEVSDSTFAASATTEKTVVTLYERWLKTGSSRLAVELGNLGIAPLKKCVGIH